MYGPPGVTWIQGGQSKVNSTVVMELGGEIEVGPRLMAWEHIYFVGR